MANKKYLSQICQELGYKKYSYFLIYKFLLTELKLLKPKNKTAKDRNYYIKIENGIDVQQPFEEKYKFDFMDVFVDNLNTWTFFMNRYNLENKTKSYLEIGCFEGMSSVFILKKLKNAQCTFVDPFLPYEEMNDAAGISQFDRVYNNFIENTSHHKERINIHRVTSDVFFEKNTNNFDLIYIDGSHYGEDVYKDSINSFKFLNVGGFIIFDDFFWIHFDGLNQNPIGGITRFLIENRKQIKIIYLSDQLFIQKL